MSEKMVRQVTMPLAKPIRVMDGPADTVEHRDKLLFDMQTDYVSAGSSLLVRPSELTLFRTT